MANFKYPIFKGWDISVSPSDDARMSSLGLGCINLKSASGAKSPIDRTAVVDARLPCKLLDPFPLGFENDEEVYPLSNGATNVKLRQNPLDIMSSTSATSTLLSKLSLAQFLPLCSVYLRVEDSTSLNSQSEESSNIQAMIRLSDMLSIHGLDDLNFISAEMQKLIQVPRPNYGCHFESACIDQALVGQNDWLQNHWANIAEILLTSSNQTTWISAIDDNEGSDKEKIFPCTHHKHQKHNNNGQGNTNLNQHVISRPEDLGSCVGDKIPDTIIIHDSLLSSFNQSYCNALRHSFGAVDSTGQSWNNSKVDVEHFGCGFRWILVCDGSSNIIPPFDDICIVEV